TVIGLAVKGSTSPLFVKACDEFLYLRPTQGRGEKGTRDSVSAGEAAPARGGQRGKGHGEKTGEREAVKARSHAKVPEVARSVVKRLLGAAAGPINPSLIKETIVRKEPDFDERDHGYSSLARLLEAMEQEGLLKLQQQGRQWYVVSPETETESPKGRKHGAHSKRAAPVEDPADEDELESYPDPEDAE
ncbi:MAG TPA: OST-HTH/LOTUS domain-containing protein, partial [Myxococcaceae bacterium]